MILGIGICFIPAFRKSALRNLSNHRDHKHDQNHLKERNHIHNEHYTITLEARWRDKSGCGPALLKNTVIHPQSFCFFRPPRLRLRGLFTPTIERLLSPSPPQTTTNQNENQSWILVKTANA